VQISRVMLTDVYRSGMTNKLCEKIDRMKFETIKNSVLERWWIAAAVIGVFSYCYFELFDPYFEKRQTICKVVKLRPKHEVVVEYVRDGNVVQYTSRKEGVLKKYLHPGEKFYLTYRLRGIDAESIKFEKPVISDTALYSETTTEHCEIVGGFRIKYLRFTYIVNGKRYERAQHITDFTLAEGKVFPVKFLTKDPEQSYVCLDSANCWQVIDEDDFEKVPTPEDMGFQ
jgi:hypothetical protein